MKTPHPFTPKQSPRPDEPKAEKPTGFVQKWGGTAKKIEDKNDAWLAHINSKHMR